MTTSVTNPVRLPGISQPQYSGIAVNPSVPVGSMSAWKREAIGKAIGYSKLANNWDGHGSHAPSMAVMQTAIHLLRNVPVEDLSVPLVVPVSGGGFHFEWTVGNRELEVAIDPKGSVEMLRVQDGMPIENDQMSMDDVFAWLVD